MINVSIIIPIYNVEKYIEECIQSVLNQTITEGLECILVDDYGTDKSIEIAKSIVASYKGNVKFKFIHYGANKGIGVARNTGMSVAEGKYIFFLDSDDYLQNDCIETLLALAVKYPEADVVCGVSYSLGKQQNEDFHLCHTKYHLPEYCDNVKYIRKEFLLSHYCIHVTNKLIKKDFLNNNNISFIEGVVFEDVPWLLDCSRHIKAIAISSKDTYFYRLNGSSVMNSVNPKYLNSVAKVSDYILDTIDTKDFYRLELFKVLEFINIYNVKIGTSPLSLMKYGKNKIFNNLYKVMFTESGLIYKFYKEILIKCFKINLKISK